VKASDFGVSFPGKLESIKNGELSFLPDSPPLSLQIDHKLRMADERANRAIGRFQAIIPALPNPALITPRGGNP